MKKYFIGTSWKMNKTNKEALMYCDVLKNILTYSIPPNIFPFVIPPFTNIADVSSYIKKHNINCSIGAQNMHFADHGAYTGEISPLMLKDVGATIVEIGHSERREYFGETDYSVNKKVNAAIYHDLIPIICIGDSLFEKEKRVSAETVIRQMKIAIADIKPIDLSKIIIAYEPIWAIGEHGIPASEEEAEEIHAFLRQSLTHSYGQDIADSITIIYGGSVNKNNAKKLISQPNIDGLFIGRSAWNAVDYCDILSQVIDYLK